MSCMLRIYSLILISLISNPSRAQESAKVIAILGFNTEPISLENDKKTAQYQSITSSVFIKDKRFVVVERTKLNVIDKEKELQKSEDFIDGKVVQQGVSIGADYLITGHSDFSKNILTLTLYDVSNGKVLIKEDLDLRFDYKLSTLVKQHVVYKYFPLPGIRLVRILQGSSKAKEVLIAAGTKEGITRKEKLEVKELVFEDIDGQSVEREVMIGVIKVSQVENENFSICIVEEGGKEITEKMADGSKLFCKRTN